MALREAHFTVNRNSIPYDINGPWYTSGVRIGPPAVTTLGMKEEEMKEIADAIFDLLKAVKPASAEKTGEASRAKVDIDPKVLDSVQKRLRQSARFPDQPEELRHNRCLLISREKIYFANFSKPVLADLKVQISGQQNPDLANVISHWKL